MHLRGAPFTIRGLMIAVVIVAGMLALPAGWLEVAAVLSLPCLALFAAWRLLLGGPGDAAGGSPTSFTSMDLDVGHRPGGDAGSDFRDRLAVPLEIPDREIRPGPCGGSDRSRGDQPCDLPRRVLFSASC
jgi:hypothetical protein